MLTIATLKKGERGTIQDFDIDAIPLKLIEMGCLPGNIVELVQHAPFHDPLYVNLNGCYVAIRADTAMKISIKKDV